eukprot:1576057-Amphidinium_carterae.1
MADKGKKLAAENAQAHCLELENRWVASVARAHQLLILGYVLPECHGRKASHGSALTCALLAIRPVLAMNYMISYDIGTTAEGNFDLTWLCLQPPDNHQSLYELSCCPCLEPHVAAMSN